MRTRAQRLGEVRGISPPPVRCQCGAPMVVDEPLGAHVVLTGIPRCSVARALRDDCDAPTKVRVMPARRMFADLPWMVQHQIRYRPDDSILGVVGQPIKGMWNWMTTPDPRTRLPRMGWAKSRDEAVETLLREHPG